MFNLFISVIIVLAGSAFCSLTETVLLSVSDIKVKQWAQSKKSLLPWFCYKLKRK